MEAHRAVVAAALEVLVSDERIQAIWLGGSLGAGIADAFSDVDLYCAVADASMAEFSSGLPDLLRRIAPCVLVAPITAIPGAWAAKTENWVHVDVVPVAASALAQRKLRDVEILHDPQGILRLADRTADDTPFFPDAVVATGFYLLGQLPVLLARNEPVLAQAGYATLRDAVLVPLLLAEVGRRPSGPKRLRTVLGEERHEILRQLPIPSSEPTDLLCAYIHLGRIVIERARALSQSTGSTWPAAAEAALQQFLVRTLGRGL